MDRFDDFMQQLKAGLAKTLADRQQEDLVIGEIEVVKVNDQKLRGFTIRPEGADAAPTFYANQYFDDYLQGRDAEDIASEMADFYNSQTWDPPAFSGSKMDFSFDKIRSDLSIRVLEEERNMAYLADKPYEAAGNGLAVIYVINKGEGYGVTVNNAIFEEMGVDLETLHEAAVNNTLRIDAPVLRSMEEALFAPGNGNLLDRNDPVPEYERAAMYVLTNESGYMGAAGMVMPEIMRKAVETIGDDVYILPSSLHEVILVPESSGQEVAQLSDLVHQANRTVVRPEEIFSDEVYFYDLHEHKVECLTKEYKEEAIQEEEEELEM